MPRAHGARSQLAAAFETVYGTPPAANRYRQMQFAVSTLGSEQGLVESELLGFGRDRSAPTRDEVVVDGDITVPIDTRGFGVWLSAMFGFPITTGAVAATGSIVFAAQPAANSTISVGGTVFTFVAAAPTGNQILIGANLGATLTNIVTALNASVVPAVAAATYGQSGGNTLTIVHDTLGIVGNTFALAASTTPASAGTVSGATLTGGLNRHEFRSGGWDLPSLSIEVGMPEVPYFGMFAGIRVGQMTLAMPRTGNVTAVLQTVGQREIASAVPVTGTLTQLGLQRFGAFQGEIRRNGAPLGNLVAGSVVYNNGLDRIATIRDDGAIDGVDPGMASLTGNMDVRFADMVLLDQAIAGGTCELQYSYEITPSLFFRLTAHSVFLPKPRIQIPGPSGIQASFAWQAARDPVLGRTCTVELINDMASFANP